MLLLGSGVTHLRNTLHPDHGTETVHTDVFPDTEQYIKTPANLPKHVYYLQSFHPHPDTKIIETLLTCDALQEQDTDFTTVFPYAPYAKQDKTFEKGEPVSIRAILHALRSRGLSAPFFVNTHFLKTPGVHNRFNLRCTNLNMAPRLVDAVVEQEALDNPVVALPGDGAAPLLPGNTHETVVVETEREKRGNKGDAYRAVDTVTVQGTGRGLEDRDVIVLDDMIATGGTMTQTCETVREHGADTVCAAAVHGLFLDNAAEQVGRVADAMYTADTVPTPGDVDTVPVAPVLGETFTSDPG